MNILDDLIKQLRGKDRVKIAYESGVSLSTLNKLLSGENTNPTLDTLTALRAYLDKEEKGNGTVGQGG